MNYATLKGLLAALEQQSVTYAIFGAVALNLHGLARFTEDLDIFIAPEAANIERLKVALRAVVEIQKLIPSRPPISLVVTRQSSTRHLTAPFASTS